MNKLMLCIAAMLFFQIGFAYPIVLEGKLLDKDQKGISNIEIHIDAHPNIPNFSYKNVQITDDQGYFADTITIPDALYFGWLMVSFMDCDSNRVNKRVVFNRSKRHHFLRLHYCQNQPNDSNCFVKIVPFRTDTGVILKTISLSNQDYEYVWNTGETTHEILVTEKGNYCVEVKDSNGCHTRDCIQIRIPKDCETKISINRPINSSSLTGNMLTAHTKGKAPFSFAWSTGDTTQRIFVQDTGTYCVDVVDSSGCMSSDCVIVKLHCETNIKLIRTDLNAVRQPTLLAQSYGHPPFTYSWSTGDTSRTILGSYDREYCVTVTDALGCTSRGCALFPSDRFCKTEIKLNPNSLTNSTARIGLVAKTKGHEPFVYLWSNGDTLKFTTLSDSITKYCVTVTDVLGCESEACFDLENLMDRCKVSIIRRSPNQIMAVPFGIPPFKYIWDNGSDENHIKIDSAGTYCVEMTDAIGCISSACIEIKESDLPSLCNVRIKASRLSNGQTELSIHTPGNMDYAIDWDNGATAPSIVIDTPGTYCVTVTNAFCKAETCISLNPNQNINNGIGKIINMGKNNTGKARIHFGPNPFKDELFLSLDAPQSGKIILDMYSLDGHNVKKVQLHLDSGINEHYLNFHQLQAGIYVIHLIGDRWNESFRVIKQP